MPTNPTDSLERELTYAVPEIHPYHRALVAVFIREREKGLREEIVDAWKALGTDDPSENDDPDVSTLRSAIEVSLQYERDLREQTREQLADARAEVATLLKEREYRFDDLATFKDQLAEKNREIERLNLRLGSQDLVLSNMSDGYQQGRAFACGQLQPIIDSLRATNTALKTEVELLLEFEREGRHQASEIGSDDYHQALAALDRLREEQR